MIAFRNGEIVFVGKYVRVSDFEYIATSEGFYILFLYKDEERRSQCVGWYFLLTFQSRGSNPILCVMYFYTWNYDFVFYQWKRQSITQLQIVNVVLLCSGVLFCFILWCTRIYCFFTYFMFGCPSYDEFLFGLVRVTLDWH